jgi:Ferredoxin thioredoxin reductase variable alpha chain
MKVGDRVRVKQSVVIYHHPEHRNEAFDLNGTEGQIHNILSDWHGRPISPNLPIHVEFKAQRKFTAHFRPEELEAIEQDA